MGILCDIDEDDYVDNREVFVDDHITKNEVFDLQDIDQVRTRRVYPNTEEPESSRFSEDSREPRSNLENQV